MDAWEGQAKGVDTEQPEDWIASTTLAVNSGMEPVENEGLATVLDNDGGEHYLKDVLRSEPDHFLGKKHFDRNGPELGFLMKLLDARIRLHVQAHPTREFARKHLDSRYGKLETYYVLAVREDTDPYIRLGFQRAPSRQQWRQIVLDQDISAMDSCFDKVPVAPGEVWVVPGGVPHAIGEGLLLLEVMEPTDLVVRCEFMREGVVLPPEARFMQCDPDLSLQIFSLDSMSVEEVTTQYRIKPEVVLGSPAASEEILIGPRQTDCFETRKLVAREEFEFSKKNKVGVCIVIEGHGEVSSHGESLTVKQSSSAVSHKVV